MGNDDIFRGCILSRREALGLFGAAGIVIAAGCGGGSGSSGLGTGLNAGASAVSSGSTSTTTGASSSTGTSTSTGSAINLVATPALTEGPFFVDERLNRSNLTTNTTRASVVNGLPLTLRLGVYSLNGNVGTPLSGAQADIWHADAIGTYSDENNGSIQSENTLGQTWLRGYQTADQNGAVEFTTIYPGWYVGRTVHIHFKVRQFSLTGAEAYEFTSQFFFDDAINDIVLANAPYNTRGTRSVRNATDGIYNGTGADSIADGSQLTLTLTPATTGYVATFNIGLQM